MCSPATSFQGRLFRKFSPIPTRQSIEKLRSFSQHSSSFSNTQEKLEPCFDGHFQNILNKLSKHNVYKTVPSIADVSLDSNVRLTLFSGVLRSCASKGCLNKGKAVQGQVIKNGMDPDLDFWDLLASLYVKCGSLQCARQVLDEMPERDVVSWTVLIKGLVDEGYSRDGVTLYGEMRKDGIRPDGETLVSALKACLGCLELEFGLQLHAEVIKMGLFSNFLVGSAFVEIYSKCGLMELASMTFFYISKKSVVSWNALIDGYALMGDWEEILNLFCEIRELELKHGKFTLLTVLKSCAHLGNLRGGKAVHAQAIKIGSELDKFLSCCLLNMYSKCEFPEYALKVFQRIRGPKIAAWSAMIHCLHQGGQSQEAAEMFCLMRHSGFGRQVHARIIKDDLRSNGHVGTALLDMYAKCRCLEDADVILNELTERDLLTWTAIISNFAQSNQGQKAVKCFIQMQQEGLKPNKFTFSSCLSGCSSLALLDCGRQLHSLTIKSGLSCNTYVATALVDMYGQCRCIEDAEAVFKGMASRNASSWNTIICGYSLNGQGNDALKAFRIMLDEGFLPDEITFIGVLSACSHMGLIEEGETYFNSLSRYYGITPTIEHYACMVNILSRAGKFIEMESFIEKWKLTNNPLIWETILWASKEHGNVGIGERAAEKLFELEPRVDYNYVLLSHIYAAKGRWDDVVKVRALMSYQGIQKERGCSWLEIDGEAQNFFAQDLSHPKIREIRVLLEGLSR
ncbi:pentatricopeptide repeat-containing protein At2g33680-like [Quercus suber]|uniref:pentatricopeptide repeat-containing protein At2g33680-like n=1 Tax=Quercus suber TaxID=58331 RepID=UPI000CE1E5F3|nr:pentatricopeptide repeat-containing protein At2g33680-like [Quercus suber]